MITTLRKWRSEPRSTAESVASSRRIWRDHRLLVPLGAGAIYLVVVAARLPSILSSFYWYGDFPAALRLGDAVFHGGWGQGLQLRDQAGLGPLWVVGLLNQVTGSATASMALGGAVTVASVGFMVTTARRVMDAPSSVLVGVLAIAAPPVVAWEALSPLAHSSTLLLTSVGAWQLVALRDGRRNRAIVSSLVVGTLAGVCAASDTLVIAAAIGPWVICATVLARRHGDARVPLLITACITIASGATVAIVAHANGFVVSGLTLSGPSIQGIGAGLDVAAATLGQMISGAWYADTLPSVLTIGAFTLFLGATYLATKNVIRTDGGLPTGRSVYVWFWALSGAGLIAAMCVSGLGIQTSPVNYQGHYLNGLWFALAALLPIVFIEMRLRRRWGVSAVSALALVSAIGILRLTPYPLEGPDYVDDPQLTATLTQLGVTHGYGSYWESYAIGWHTDQRISVLPLQSCTAAPNSSDLCRYRYAAPASYVAQRGPVFVIVLRGSCRDDILCIDHATLAGLAPPELVRTVGLLQIDVYSRDFFAALPLGGA